MNRQLRNPPRSAGPLATSMLGVILVLCALLSQLSLSTYAGRTKIYLSASTSRSKRPRSTASVGAPPLALTAQSPWVQPGQSFDMTLATHVRTPPSKLTLEVTVFSGLPNRSSFEDALSGNFTTRPVTYLGPLPLQSLPPGSTGGVNLDLGVDAGGTVSTGRFPYVADLGCQPTNCDGVYPLHITLDGPSGKLSSLTTFLVFQNPAQGGNPLRVAVVLPAWTPLSQPVQAGSLSPADAHDLSVLASSLQAHSLVPSTLELYGQTALALSESTLPASREALADLAQLAQQPADHELADPTYSPVDPAQLTAVPGALQLQLATGTRLITAALNLHAPSLVSDWVSTKAIAAKGVDALYKAGFRGFVLPPSNFSSVPNQLTPTKIFRFAPGGTGLPVSIADPELTREFSYGNDPVLAANHLLADLAQIYLDAPDSPSTRAITATAPLGWTPNSAFLGTLLSGLQDSPVLTPVTLGTLISKTAASSDRSYLRAASGLTSGFGSISSQIESSATRFAGFSSAAGAHVASVNAIGYPLLASEGLDLTVASRRIDLDVFHRLLEDQLAGIGFTPDRTIIITARLARIPITVTSQLPYPIQVHLTLLSNKLSFPHGSTRLVRLDRRNNAIYFTVEARVSGDFPLTVLITSPKGHQTLVLGRFTVRSTAVSIVAVILSVGAASFLAGWWLLTVVRARRGQRARPSRAKPLTASGLAADPRYRIAQPDRTR